MTTARRCHARSMLRGARHWALLTLVVGAPCWAGSVVVAQPGAVKNRQRPANPPELKRLEAKAEEVRESFLRDKG